MSTFPLSAVSEQLLKYHLELCNFFNGRVAAGSSSHMRIRSDDNGLEISVFENGRGYRLSMKRPRQSGEQTPVSVSLIDGTAVQSEEASLSKVLTQQLPEAFTELRDRALKALRRALPESVFQALGGSKPEAEAAPTAPAPQDVPPAPAGGAPTEAEASQPAPEESEALAGEPATSQAPAASPAPLFQEYRVLRQGQPDLVFQGRLLANVQSEFRGNRSHVLQLYQTPKGKYVAVLVGLSMWLGERTTVKCCVCNSREEVAQFFGYSELAKSLYRLVGMETVERVD